MKFMQKRKTRKWPDFVRRPRPRVKEFISVCSVCPSEPICINPNLQ